ncbi:MAG: PAS domain S-box protein, partial [Anaerolineae bacterium]|nr:PAS domain S-box protein [Anaerolineae bacterium]
MSEQKYRGVVEQSFDGIRLVDREGRIIAWNQACERITGLGRTEMLDKFIWDVQYQLLPDGKSPADYERIKHKVQEFLRSGQVTWQDPDQVYVIQRPDGAPRFIEEMVFPVNMDEGFLGCAITR